MNRIEQLFIKKSKQGKKALVTYTVAGDPTIKKSKKVLEQLITSGADIIEIGIPFSDPMSEGPVIQKAHERSLKNQTNLDLILKISSELRLKNEKVPIVLMGYMNSFLSMGKQLYKNLSKAGIDGIIVVDLPYDESHAFFSKLKEFHIDLIRLISPTTDNVRLKNMLSSSSGYLYYVSLKGITGSKIKNFSEVQSKVKKIKSLTDLPVVVGFGIKDPLTAKKMSSFSDGIVVGSKIVELVEKNSITKINQLTKSLKRAID